ncbi:hypothetical protein WG954_12770 [Lacibacter sp. H375]|uniref:hypothetical protein n=1 Tax=Lacibacter sp. H375 TaxID=3133424 RepID=UPI0030C0267E
MKSIHRIPFLLLLVFIFSSQLGMTQCDASDDRSAGSVSNNNSTGIFSWSNATNVYTSNNQYASAGYLLGILATVHSNYMMLEDFDLGIPGAVTICGIEVIIERKASGLGLLGASVRDHTLRLVKNGSIVGTNKANTSTNWTGSATTITYGSSSDLWGTTWTPADVNDEDFGLAFTAELKSGLAGLFLSADVDDVRIVVYYQHIVLPVGLAGFSCTAKNNTVELTWETKQDHTIKEFAVERKIDNSDWINLQSIYASDVPGQKKKFLAYDQQPSRNNNYRLKIVDVSGAVSYSEIIQVKLQNEPEDLLIKVNSSNKTVEFQGADPILRCNIFKPSGKLISFIPNQGSNTQFTLPASSLPEGHLIVQAHTKSRTISRQIYIRK